MHAVTSEQHNAMHSGFGSHCRCADTEIERLRNEVERLTKMAYLTIRWPWRRRRD